MGSHPQNDRHRETTMRNTLFEALTNPTRRRVLRYLEAAGGETTVSRLRAELMAEEATASQPATDQQLLVSLVHVHLPKLQAAGLIEWDRQRVSLSDDASVLPLSRPLKGGLLYEPFTRQV